MLQDIIFTGIGSKYKPTIIYKYIKIIKTKNLKNSKKMSITIKDVIKNTNYPTIQPKNKTELKNIIEDAIKKVGLECDLNFIDTSLITNMSYLFLSSKFNGDISKWDVSKVKNMSCMFQFNSNFNQDISKWDVSNVEDMSFMFLNNKDFNQDISKWSVSKVKKYQDIFKDCYIKNWYKPIFKLI